MSLQAQKLLWKRGLPQGEGSLVPSQAEQSHEDQTRGLG